MIGAAGQEQKEQGNRYGADQEFFCQLEVAKDLVHVPVPFGDAGPDGGVPRPALVLR
jgi:hypothetical protein